jgi:hypothetical protein
MLTVADIEGRTLVPLSTLLDAASVPDDAPPAAGETSDVVDRLAYVDAALDVSESGYVVRVVLALDEEIVLAPFGDALSIVFGGGGGLSVFGADARIEKLGDGIAWQVELVEVPVSLRVGGGLLRPVKPGTDEVDETKSTLDILLGGVTVGFGTERGFELTFAGSPSVPRCMIGDTGIILSVGSIRWLTPASENLPAETPDDFTGLFLDDAQIELTGLSLPANTTLDLDYGFFGSGGITAKIDLQNIGLQGSLGGFTFDLEELDLTFVQSALTESRIGGQITVPFFDEPLDVALSVNLGGGFTVALSSADGLVELNKPGILDLELDGVTFGVDNGVFAIALSGKITPLVRDLDWPTFEVQALGIDSQGHVTLQGGWLDLHDGYVLRLYGFQLEITKIGFGTTTDNQRWVGFRGG